MMGETRYQPSCVFMFMLVLSLTAGCGVPDVESLFLDADPSPRDDSDGAASPPSPQGDGGVSPSQDQASPPGDGESTTSCTGYSAPTKRDYTLTIKHGGLKRTAVVHIPPGYDGTKPVALVFNNHGNMHYASMQAKMSHLNEFADKRNVVTVAPQGTGGLATGWNVGKSPMGYVYDKVDDVGFFKAMLDELDKTICLDKRQVYCTGFSLGGSMCYRLSCDEADKFAAIASVSGPDGTVTCKPSRPVPLLHIHGTADSFAGYKPDKNGGIYKGAEFYVSNHAKRSGCSNKTKVTFTKGKVTCKTYEGCKDNVEVTLCTVEGGGHTWPGGDGWLLGGTVNKDIKASEMILDFFAKYTLP
jgi:polyhydroxybutyrate depolymerase